MAIYAPIPDDWEPDPDNDADYAAEQYRKYGRTANRLQARCNQQHGTNAPPPFPELGEGKDESESN